MSRIPRWILLSWLMTLACGDGADSLKPTGPLTGLAVPPASFPAGCDVEWRVRPYALAAAPEEEAAFFKDILGFWFGADSVPSLDSLAAGLSNVYSRDSVGHAVVAVSLRFRSSEAAAAAQAQVAQRHASEPGRWFDVEGLMLLMLSAHPEVPEQCASYLRGEVRRRSRAAA